MIFEACPCDYIENCIDVDPLIIIVTLFLFIYFYQTKKFRADEQFSHLKF